MYNNSIPALGPGAVGFAARIHETAEGDDDHAAVHA